MPLKIGIIGLGDIATKAYLPVMNKKDVEVHLFTRSKDKLSALSSAYRFQHVHGDLDSIIRSGIRAAFVHTPTSSHESIVRLLLQNDIHVYVDKPVTYHFGSTEKLVQLAEQKGLTLMAGFNRRYAPAYAGLKDLKDISMIVMQKNRKSLPGDVRTFVLDDFIHVVDTLLFLFPHPLIKIRASGKKVNGLLHHAVVEMSAADGSLAIGIMNRDSGTVEEKVEVFTPSGKWVVDNVTETTVLTDGQATRRASGDWESTLRKRGFEQVTDAFLERVTSNIPPHQLHGQILRTHEVCEDVVVSLQG